jgi:hypothetical protein
MQRRRRLRTWKPTPIPFAMSVYRARPIKKKQTLKNSCWAACLESWTHSTHLANLSEKALLKYYGQPTTGGLDLANLTTLRTWLKSTRSIKSDVVADTVLDWAWMEAALKKSYVMIAYQIVDSTGTGTNDWHAHLVYGKDNFIYFMEPKTGELEHTDFFKIWSPGGHYRFWTD